MADEAKSWIVRMDATSEQFNAIAASAAATGCPFVCFAKPQNAMAGKRIQQWFEENE